MEPDELVASDQKQVLEMDVLAYLARHPQAQDTLEGIMEWWLLEQRIERAASEVRLVLDGLVARKILKEVRRSDGQVHYRLSKNIEDS